MSDYAFASAWQNIKYLRDRGHLSYHMDPGEPCPCGKTHDRNDPVYAEDDDPQAAIAAAQGERDAWADIEARWPDDDPDDTFDADYDRGLAILEAHEGSNRNGTD